MHLYLAQKNPARILEAIQTGLAAGGENLRIDLLGPGCMLNDTALMAYHVLRERPGSMRLHAHSHTCLINGAILPWLAADTRSIRPDAWIQVSHPREGGEPLGLKEYPTALSGEEPPSLTDLRTIHRLLNEFLPVEEIAGMRLFEADLRELGLISEPGEIDPLAEYFRSQPDEDLQLDLRQSLGEGDA